MANCNTCENQEKCLKLSPCIVEAYEQGRAEERKAIFDEFYNKILNDDDEVIIEWLQNNLIDNVKDY